MPRDGSNVFSPPAGTAAGPAGTTISSANFNTLVADLVTDANLARPIVAGGTGATNAAAALANLGGQPVDADLTALAALTTTGQIVRTGAGTVATRSLATGGANITITNADGVAGNPTVALTPGPLTEIGGLTPVQGDLLYRNATVVTRLPKGTAGQVLRMNTGATEPEWATPQTITATGTAPLFACRAWVNFNGGDGVARGSGNATVTRNAVGDYTITFTTAMPDAAYAVVSQLSRNSGAGGATENLSIETMTASQVRLIATWANAATGGNFDPTFCSVSIFR